MFRISVSWGRTKSASMVWRIKDQNGNDQREENGGNQGTFHSFADPFLFLAPKFWAIKVERHFRIPVPAYRQTSLFYCCRKGGHDYSAKTIDQSLYHQNAQIHHRLLYTGQCGERSDLFQAVTVEMQVVAV